MARLSARCLFATAPLVAAAALAGWPRAAHAQQPSARSAAAGEAASGQIARARDFVTFAQFREALRILEPLSARTDLRARDRVLALEALATCYIAFNRTADARRTVEALYAADPGHTLSDPDASPRITNFFSKVHREFQPPSVVRLHHEPIHDLRARTGVRAVVTIETGAEAIDELRLQYRRQFEAYARVPMTGEAERGATIPLFDLDRDAYRVQYYVEAVAPSGHVLASVGTENAPLSFNVPSAAEAAREIAAPAGPLGGAPAAEPVASSGSVFGKWWFWTAVAVVAIGAGVSAYYVPQAVAGPRDGSLGNQTTR